MNNLMFSVLVITYNQEKFIAKTLDSILTQEHNYNYEIVIGEDCSTDGTRSIIENYAKKYPEVIKPIYNNPNLGLIKNYFNTLSHCTGKYIMECAGDDWWLPGKVAFQIDYMEKHLDVGMCYGQAKQWIENKSKFSKRLFGIRKETFEDLLQGNVVPAPSVCFRNDLVKRYISEIDPVNKNWIMEDYPEWLWFAEKSKVHFNKIKFCVYRVLPQSESHQISIEKYINFRKSTYEIQNYFSRLYYNRDFLPFNEHLHKFYYYVISNNRTAVMHELNYLNNSSWKILIFKVLCSNKILFSLINKYYIRQF